MNAAEMIIERFGGQTALAEMLNKGQSTIQYWAKKGVVPAKWRPILVNLAEEKNISLSFSDFDVDVFVAEAEGQPKIAKATHWGELTIGIVQIPCYVLENGERIFSLKGVVVALTQTEGGALAEYIKVKAIRPFLPPDLVPEENNQIPALLKFDTGDTGIAKNAIGVPVERFIDLCAAYTSALQHSLMPEGMRLSEKQNEIAIRASSFLIATAKTGIIALVDEATGYQYDRASDALQFKLNLFLAEEMRKWEKTYPDELWTQFGRLTHWKGSLNSRPKYWGKLVNELVYGYLDSDVYNWLKKNAPKPTHGQNYHQWLNSQYGLKKLTEHLWQLVGMASACTSMEELRRKMAEKYGKIPIQMTLYLPPSSK